MPKIRASCCLCLNELEYNGERYTGIKFARSAKRTDAMAKHIGLSLNEMSIFKNAAEICHRHYDPSSFYFEEKLKGNIHKALILNADILPTVNHRDIVRLKLIETPSVIPIPGSQSVQDLINTFNNGVQNPITQRVPTSTTLLSSSLPLTVHSNSPPTRYNTVIIKFFYIFTISFLFEEINTQSDFEMHDHDFDSESHLFDSNIIDESDEEIEYEYFQMPKFLLTEGNKLLQLFQHCFACGTAVTATPSLKICGTAITVKFWCKKCNAYKKWSSQSTIENTQRYIGNVLVPSTAVLTPINYPSLSEFAQTLGLPMIKWSTYNRVARKTHDVIVDKWNVMQQKILTDVIKKQDEGEDTCVSADCQFDSRGYCASQGCETVMCSKTKLVLTGKVLERSETNNNSGAMEVEGLKRCLEELESKAVKVKVLTTDRSKSVITFMLQFPDILHLFDSWHLFKSLNKSFREAAKLKTAAEMKVWVGPLLNHMWHSVKAANGDGDQCIQFMMTSLIHSLGVHEWQPGRLEDVLREAHSKFVLNRIEKAKYKKNNPSLIESKFVKDFQMTLSQCPHSYRPPNIVEDNRLPVYSKVYNVILKTLTKEHTIKDMMKVSPNLTTSALENLHSLITGKYRPKEVYYPKNHSTVLTYLAYYHHNMNIFDEIKGDRYYIRKRMIKSRQKGGDLVVKYVKNAPNLTWKIEFNEELINRYSNKVAASTFVEVNGDEEGEESFSVRIDDEFDEDLVEDIIAGNLPDEFIDLLQVDESNDEESDNEN